MKPIHKKEKRNNPANYRLISLLHITSKIYAQSLLKHLPAWAFESGIIPIKQGGFRKKLLNNKPLFLPVGSRQEVDGDCWPFVLLLR